MAIKALKQKKIPNTQLHLFLFLLFTTILLTTFALLVYAAIITDSSRGEFHENFSSLEDASLSWTNTTAQGG